MSQPAALLFDMDGLLLDTERLAQRSFVDVAATYGIVPDDARRFFLTLVGSSSAQTHRQTQNFLGPEKDVTEFAASWSCGFDRLIGQGVPIKPGVAGALATLAGAGHRMAVVTSTRGARARDQLHRAELLQHFEYVTGGDEVSAHKPDPAPYLESAAKLGVHAGDCIAFEDSDRGLASAVSAGCRAVQIPDLRPLDRPLPDLGQVVLETLEQAILHLDLARPL